MNEVKNQGKNTTIDKQKKHIILGLMANSNDGTYTEQLCQKHIV